MPMGGSAHLFSLFHLQFAPVSPPSRLSTTILFSSLLLFHFGLVPCRISIYIYPETALTALFSLITLGGRVGDAAVNFLLCLQRLFETNSVPRHSL